MSHDGPLRPSSDADLNGTVAHGQAGPGSLGPPGSPPDGGDGGSEFRALREPEKQFFVFSKAGKPVLSSHGDEEAMSPVFAMLQALVSVVRDSLAGATPQQLVAGRHRFVFAFHGALCFVVVATTGEPYPALARQLERVRRYILFHLTAGLDSLLDSRPHFDTRCLLVDTGATTQRLLAQLRDNPGYFLHAVRCLPLPAPVRGRIGERIAETLRQCDKCPDLLAAILCTDGLIVQLITCRNVPLDTVDVLLLLNHVQGNDHYYTEDSFTPVCLPELSPGMLYAYTHRVWPYGTGPPLHLVLLTHSPEPFELPGTAEKVCESLKRSLTVGEDLLAPEADLLAPEADLLAPEADLLADLRAAVERHVARPRWSTVPDVVGPESPQYVLYRCHTWVQYVAIGLREPEAAAGLPRDAAVQNDSKLNGGLQDQTEEPTPKEDPEFRVVVAQDQPLPPERWEDGDGYVRLLRRCAALRYLARLRSGLYVSDDLPGEGLVALLVTPHFEVYGRFGRTPPDLEGELWALAGRIQARASELFLCDLRALD